MRTLTDEDTAHRRLSANREDFEHALGLFLETIRTKQREYFLKHYPNLPLPLVSVDPGAKKYVRVVTDNGSQRSVFCFVDIATGDILKSDGWKRPAKHSRGSIYTNAGWDAITVWGANYIYNGGF
jgi:hypothetical protein